MSLLFALVWTLHGCADPGPERNTLQALVTAGLATGDSTIRIPPGRYEVVPTNGVHLLIENVSDVTIDATGVEMVCTETTLAVHLKSCRNVRIQGLTIDYDPLPFTQGRIVEIAEDRKSHRIEIMEGFPPAEAAYVFKHSIYTSAGQLRFGNYYKFQLEPLSETELKIHHLEEGKDGGEQVGDIVIVSAQHLTGPYRAHAVIVENSIGTVMEEVTLYSSPCFGFFEDASSGSVYRNCVIDRRVGRVHSLNADAFHSKHAEVGPRIIGCRAMWQGDDAVNICGTYHFVSDVQKNVLRVVAMRRMNIQPGDRLQIVQPDGKILPESVAVSVRPLGRLNVADTDALEAGAVLREILPALRKVYEIQLDRVLELPKGSAIGSLNRRGNGFAVINCHFGNNRSRGILVKASEGEVSGNFLENCHMQAIKVGPEFHWLESGFSQNLVIRNNRIHNPGREAIQVVGVGAFPGHENIAVIDNFIESDADPVVTFNAVRHGRIYGNDFRRLDGRRIESPVRSENSENIGTAP